MEERIVDFKEVKKELKRQKRKEWFNRKREVATEWVCEHKEAVAMLTPAVFSAVTAVVKAVSKHAAQKKEAQLKDLYCYDRSLGHYWKLRRELTNSEWIEIEKRKQQGAHLGDILSELKVLK